MKKLYEFYKDFFTFVVQHPTEPESIFFGGTGVYNRLPWLQRLSGLPTKKEAAENAAAAAAEKTTAVATEDSTLLDTAIDSAFPKQDAAVRWQMGFQDPATPVAEGIFDFHHELFYVVVFIVFFVGLLLIRCIQLFDSKKNETPANFVHQTTVEVVWTLIPAYILLLIAVPSFALLYSMDEVIDPEVTLKVLGHQWYWCYEYSDYSTQHR